ncbi:MAG: glutathione transferase GstA [Pseudolabrys sp.]
MKLYYSPGACSLSPHIVLREAGLPFDLVRVDTKTKKTESGDDYWAVNPKGSVPALKLDDGDVITEGPAIVQYLADKAGKTDLAPAAGTKERTKLQEWLNYITSELHKGFTPLFKPDTPADYKPTAKANLMKQFAYLDKQLAGKDFLLGKTFSVADAYLFVVMNWRKFQNLEIAEFKNLSAYVERVAARAKVKEAMVAEGLIKAA